MYIFFAVLLELILIMVVGCHIYGYIPSKKRLVIWGIIIILYAIMEEIEWVKIPVIVHYMLLEITILTLFGANPIWVIPYATLIGYAVLIYVQVIWIYWFPEYWISDYYDITSLLLNVLVLAMILMISAFIRWRKIDLCYKSMGKVTRSIIAIISALVVIFCMIFKPILETEYQIDTYAYFVLMGTVIIILQIVYQEVIKRRSQRKIEVLEKEVANYKEVIQQDQSQMHEYAKKLRTVQSSGNVELIEQLLKEQKEYSIFRALQPSIKSILNSNAERLRKSKIELRLSGTAGIPEFEISDIDMIHILGNLLDNAVEAVEDLPEEQRWIEIKLGDEDYKWICVSNPCKSVAMSAERMLERGASSKGDGRGYGLYNVKQTVQRYGGEVRIVAGEIFRVMVEI